MYLYVPVCLSVLLLLLLLLCGTLVITRDTRGVYSIISRRRKVSVQFTDLHLYWRRRADTSLAVRESQGHVEEECAIDRRNLRNVRSNIVAVMRVHAHTLSENS